MQDQTVGERIRLLRETLKKQDKKKYSLESVATRTGVVTKQSLSLIERGIVKNPGAVALNKLAADFGVTIDFLLTGISGSKEGFLERKQQLATLRDSCQKNVLQYRAACSPSAHFLYDKMLNLLELFSVVVSCLNREVLENYDQYTSEIDKLIKFLEYFALVIPVIGQEPSLEMFVDRAFWELGKVIRQIAIRIDEDGNLRSFYPQELRQIADTAASVRIAAENQELPAATKVLEVSSKDFHLKLTYHGPINIPDECLEEFKKRVIFEWGLILTRANTLNVRLAME